MPGTQIPSKEMALVKNKADRRVGIVINVGLVWLAVMALCAQKWRAEGGYFLIFAALGAAVAMAGAWRIRSLDEGLSATGSSDSPMDAISDVQWNSTASALQLIDVPQVEKFEREYDEHYRTFARLLHELSATRNPTYISRSHTYFVPGHHGAQTYRATRAALLALRSADTLLANIDTSTLLANIDQRVLTQTRLQDKEASDSARVVHNLKGALGKRYVLDFGTVKIEIDGDNAKIDLSAASNVTIEDSTRTQRHIENKAERESEEGYGDSVH